MGARHLDSALGGGRLLLTRLGAAILWRQAFDRPGQRPQPLAGSKSGLASHMRGGESCGRLGRAQIVKWHRLRGQGAATHSLIAVLSSTRAGAKPLRGQRRRASARPFLPHIHTASVLSRCKVCLWLPHAPVRERKDAGQGAGGTDGVDRPWDCPNVFALVDSLLDSLPIPADEECQGSEQGWGRLADEILELQSRRRRERACWRLCDRRAGHPKPAKEGCWSGLSHNCVTVSSALPGCLVGMSLGRKRTLSLRARMVAQVWACNNHITSEPRPGWSTRGPRAPNLPAASKVLPSCTGQRGPVLGAGS
jgi:hypothetical protein